MNVLTPVLIAVACVTPVLIIAIGLKLWIRRQSDQTFARIKVLRSLLWFLGFVAIAGTAALLLLGGCGITSVTQVLIPFTSLGIVAVGIAFQIHTIRKRTGTEN